MSLIRDAGDFLVWGLHFVSNTPRGFAVSPSFTKRGLGGVRGAGFLLLGLQGCPLSFFKFPQDWGLGG